MDTPRNIDNRRAIPARSFGLCHWCGSRQVRLQYLMCNNCFNIAVTIPPKIQIFLRDAEVKKQLKGGQATPKNVVPMFREFLMLSKTRFPAEPGYQNHWQTILEELPKHILPDEVRKYAETLMDADADIPEDREIARRIGIEKFLYFVIKVAILRGVLKLDYDENEEGFCVVCWKTTASKEHMLCPDCRDALAPEISDTEPEETDEPRPYMGMNTRDIVLKKRGR